MKKQSFFISLFLLLAYCCMSIHSVAQSKLRISILTCASGEEIYSIWGHTAVRIVDSSNHFDVVYNFGTFDFDEPHFVPKFVKGSLLYFISATSFEQFMYEYQYFKRDVDEQILNLSEAEKEKWRQALSENMIGNNRYYLYNFIYDNCTTRIKDGLFNHAQVHPTSIGVKSFRPYIVNACYSTNNHWIGFGIDLLLGSESDKTPSENQQGFLPPLFFNMVASIPNLVAATKHYTFNNGSLVVSNRNQVFYILILFALFYALASNWNTLLIHRIGTFMDVTLLMLLGLGGVLVLYMSVFSLHSACHENYNLIWLHPIYLLLLPLYFTNHTALRYLGFILFTMTCLMMLLSYWIPQAFSKEVIVLMCIALLLQIRMIKRANILALKK